MTVQAIRRWLSYLTDPEKERYFHSDDPESYVLLYEHIDNLIGAMRSAEERGVALPGELAELLDLLLEIEKDTDDVGYERWTAFVETDPKWKRAIALAGLAKEGLVSG